MYSYDDLMYETNLINFKGRELQVCTFYRPPVSYLNRTVKRIIDGEEENVYLADNGNNGSFKHHTHKINFKFNIITSSINQSNNLEDLIKGIRNWKTKFNWWCILYLIFRSRKGWNGNKDIFSPSWETQFYLDDTKAERRLQVVSYIYVYYTFLSMSYTWY